MCGKMILCGDTLVYRGEREGEQLVISPGKTSYGRRKGGSGNKKIIDVKISDGA